MSGHWTSRFRGFSRAADPGRFVLLIGRQPTWVMKSAAVAAVLVLSALVLILVIPTLVVGIIVFLLAGLLARLRRLVARGLPRSDGRRNVRVIVRRDDAA